MTREEEVTIQEALSGEPDATRALVDGHKGALAAFLQGLTGNRDVTEDLAQESFLRAFSSLENFKPGGTFRGWLFGIAYHVHVDYLRKRRETPVQGLVEDESIQRFGAVSRIRAAAEGGKHEEAEEKVVRLRQALGEMNAESRAVLSARYLQDLGRNEIAEMLGISENNVKMRLYRAKKELATRFERLLRKSG